MYHQQISMVFPSFKHATLFQYNCIKLATYFRQPCLISDSETAKSTLYLNRALLSDKANMCCDVCNCNWTNCHSLSWACRLTDLLLTLTSNLVREKKVSVLLCNKLWKCKHSETTVKHSLTNIYGFPISQPKHYNHDKCTHRMRMHTPMDAEHM
jgi:hypothetical protein